MRSFLRTTGLLVAALLVSVASRMDAQASGIDSDIDIVLLVDNSKEMETHDPKDSRIQLLHAILDLSRGRGDQRLGVLRLSRKARATGDDRVALPFTELPEDLSQAWPTIERAVRPAFGGIDDQGDGLTIIDNFQRIASFVGDRGSPPPPLWIVLVTNGDADPLGQFGGENDVPRNVVERARELAEARGALSAKREDFKSASREFIAQDVPKTLDGLGDDVVLTIVNVEEIVRREPVLDELARAAGGREVLDLDGTNVREVARKAIEQAPFPDRSSALITRALDGSRARQTVRILQATRTARIVLQGSHGNYAATLRGPSGEVSSSSDANPIRSFDMVATPPAPGEYELVIDDRAGGLDFDATLEFDLDIRDRITAPESGTIHAAGDQLELGFQLEDAKGTVLTDPHLLDGGQVVFRWTDPAGEPAPETWTPADRAAHTFRFGPDGTSNGQQDYGWKIDASLLPDERGGFEWSLPTRSGSVTTEFSMPSLRFALRDADGGVSFREEGAGGALAFEPEYVSGDTTMRATLALVVDLHGMPRVPVKVGFVPSDELASATAAGETSWTVRIDGTELGESTEVVFDEATPGEVTVSLSKSGFGTPSLPAGQVVAVVESDGVEHARAAVDVAMGPRIGLMTMLALLALLVLLALIAFALLLLRRRQDWKRRIMNLGDDDVLYFEDDELPRAG